MARLIFSTTAFLAFHFDRFIIVVTVSRDSLVHYNVLVVSFFFSFTTLIFLMFQLCILRFSYSSPAASVYVCNGSSIIL